MDVSLITPEFAAAFATSYAQIKAENAKLKRRLEEKDADIAIAFGENKIQLLESKSKEENTELIISGKAYCVPTEVEQNERTVWRNVEFSKHLKEHGLAGKLLPTSYVINWFKKQWFTNDHRGNSRLKDAGFTREQVESLTIHHVVSRAIGGANSIYNYHLMLNSLNSYFGSFFTKEMVAFVGAHAAEVARRATRRLTSHAAMDDSYDERKFDPFATDCPRRPLKRKRNIENDLSHSNFIFKTHRPQPQCQIEEEDSHCTELQLRESPYFKVTAFHHRSVENEVVMS